MRTPPIWMPESPTWPHFQVGNWKSLGGVVGRGLLAGVFLFFFSTFFCFFAPEEEATRLRTGTKKFVGGMVGRRGLSGATRFLETGAVRRSTSTYERHGGQKAQMQQNKTELTYPL